MRVSIRKYNRSYLERLGNQMECQDPTEVINYLLTELRRIHYSFNAEATLTIQVASETFSSELEWEQPTEPGQYAMSAFSAVMDESSSDPVIDRLLTVGLEQF